jgi:hypothetical protein
MRKRKENKMIDYFDTPNSMSYQAVMDEIINLHEDEQLVYLSELASHIYACPDRCDQWAIDTLNDMHDSWAEEQDERRFHDYHCS